MLTGLLLEKEGFKGAVFPEPWCRFRLSGADEDLEFVLTNKADGTGCFVNECCRVEVPFRIEKAGDGLVIRETLVNTGSETQTFSILEPLRLTLDRPLETMRHIYASGGTTEMFYPPNAYQIHDVTRNQEKLFIGCHPRGWSSNQHLPILISLLNASAESAGCFCALEWSGLWYLEATPIAGDRTALVAGVKVNGLQLAPGEALELPPVHLGFFTGGAEAATHALRKYVYEEICPDYQDRPIIPPVSYDHWFGIENGLNETLLFGQAEKAAKLGAEYFVVDSAWFVGGLPGGNGNWERVDKKKFPNGLKPIADRARELGMRFGLWFEPERAVEGSDLVVSHPDWVVPTDKVFEPKWNCYETMYHVNLALREVQDYIIEMMSSRIEELDIQWIRYDYNIEPVSFWEKVDPTFKIQFEYMKGLYRVLDTLMTKFPDLFIEGCASGGRRIDFGTLRRAHTYWFSDHTEYPESCRYMQARANRFLPGNLLNSSVPVDLGQGDKGFNATSVLSRMLGKLAFDGDIASWSAELTEEMAGYVRFFKTVRHLLVQDFYQLLPIPSLLEDSDAVQFCRYDGNESVVFAFAGNLGWTGSLQLKGLDPAGTYTLCAADGSGEEMHSGSELITAGIHFSLAPMQGGAWHIRSTSV